MLVAWHHVYINALNLLIKKITIFLKFFIIIIMIVIITKIIAGSKHTVAYRQVYVCF